MLVMRREKKPRSARRPGLLINNSRFYILLISALFSIMVVTYLRTEIISSTLYVIRVQQVFGFTALFFWYLALIASPLSSIFGKDGFMKQYLFARRAFGVSAAYFALLHMLFGVFGQLGGIGNLLLLPWRFQQAVIFGGITLIFLLIMAATSFDSVIRFMTYTRWKWLHRTSYVAAILVFLHVWMIGTHIGYSWVRWSLFLALVVLAGLESYRAARNLQKKLKGAGQVALIAYFITFFAWSVVFIAYLPRLVDGNHENHINNGSGH